MGRRKGDKSKSAHHKAGGKRKETGLTRKDKDSNTMLNNFSRSSVIQDAEIRNNPPSNENQIENNTPSNNENGVNEDENDDTIDSV